MNLNRFSKTPLQKWDGNKDKKASLREIGRQEEEKIYYETLSGSLLLSLMIL